MAINLITSPLADAPVNFAGPVINHLNAHLLNVGSHRKIANGVVRQGSLFNVGGAMYLADSDTAITGANTLAIAVKMTPSGNTLAPSYVSSLTGVAYSKDYLGWYDEGGIYYELLCRPGTGTIQKRRIKGHWDYTKTTLSAGGSILTEVYSNITGTVNLKCEWSHTGTYGGGIEKYANGTWQSVATDSVDIVMFVDVGDLFRFGVSSALNTEVTGAGFYGIEPENVL